MKKEITDLSKVIWLMLTMLAIIVLPCIGSWMSFGCKEFPPGFFKYPMTSITGETVKSNYHSKPVIIFVIISFIAVAVLYVYPRFFGFKKVPVQETEKIKKAPYPWWAWLGLAAYVVAMVFLWRGRESQPKWLLHWSDIPLFWGLALIVDGWVYRRSGGKSLVKTFPMEVVGIGVASMGGWMIFEYLNFFVRDNWYYPRGDIIGRQQFLLYAIVISSGLLPIAFMFYTWFNTFPAFKNKYSNGIKIIIPSWIKNCLIIASLAGLFCAGLFPDDLFFSLWVTPAMLVALVIDKLGIWSPLKLIGQGNWSPTLIFALTYLATGLFLEGENYFSAYQYRENGELIVDTYAPAFWKYDLPFINTTPHLFEMPLLGFLGYLPFGIYCWLWWIMWATLMNVKSRFFQADPFADSPEKPVIK